MYWENKGKLVPTRALIKTPEQIEGIRKAGIVNTGVLDEVAAHFEQHEPRGEFVLVVQGCEAPRKGRKKNAGTPDDEA